MATEIYKVLGRVKSTGAGVVSTLYTVPAKMSARIRVTVANSGSATHNFSISLSRNGAAASNGDYVCDQISLAKNVEYETAEYTLEAGTVVRVSTNDGTDFTFQAHGIEYYTPAQAAYFDVFEGGVQSTVKLYNLEDNLSYVFYTDEDSLVRVGFRGYGPDNELAVNFPSPYERSNFLTALDNARFYGAGLDGTSSQPIVYIGDNTLAGASTTTTSTSTTSTTTTTTVAPGPTTTTTSTSTTSTTTTAGPPTITVDFGRLRLGGMNFKVQLYSATVEDGLATEDTLLYDPFPDDLDFYEEFTTINWTSISDAVLYSGFQKSVPVSTLEEAYVLSAQLIGGNSLYQFRMYDVTDQNNPTLLGALPTWPVPEGEDAADYPEYGKSPSISYAEVNFSGIPLYPGKSYRLEARTDYT
jgi:hypothetical protein